MQRCTLHDAGTEATLGGWADQESPRLTPENSQRKQWLASTATRFLNVDLELVTAFGLAPLVTHLGENVVILRDSVDETTRTVWLELSAEPIDVDDAVRRYVTTDRSAAAQASENSGMDVPIDASTSEFRPLGHLTPLCFHSLSSPSQEPHGLLLASR